MLLHSHAHAYGQPNSRAIEEELAKIERAQYRDTARSLPGLARKTPRRNVLDGERGVKMAKPSDGPADEGCSLLVGGEAAEVKEHTEDREKEERRRGFVSGGDGG